MTVTSEIQYIPLNLLFRSSRNMRKTEPTAESVADLVANISAGGAVRQNLWVYPEKKGRKLTGRYAVAAGGRRLKAAQVLAERGAVPADWPMACLVGTEAEAEEVSLSENYARLPSHPADTYDAFAAMVANGHSEADIAARYDIDVGRVTRTLRLAQVSPVLVEMFRNDQLTLQHMMALTLTDDHALQERVTLGQPGRAPAAPHQIKQALTHGEISRSADRRAKFIDLDAYRQAGGAVRVDLFATDDDCYLADSGLVERLALERLEASRPDIEAEGWAWVEVMTQVDWQTEEAFGRLYPERAPLTPEASREIEDIDAKLEDLYSSEAVDEDDELAEQAQALEARRDVLTTVETRYDRAKMALAGAIIAIGHKGELEVRRGLVRSADKRALAALSGEPEAEAPKAGEGRGALSAALVENLSAHRTLALRAALVERPDVALVASVHALLLATHYKGPYGGGASDSPLQIKGRDYRDANPYDFGDDLTGGKADLAFQAARDRLTQDLPERSAQLWDHLEQCAPAELMGLLAYATAQTLCAVEQPNSRSAAKADTLAKMAQAVGLDMADWWTPTAETFFGKVPKALVLEAISEGASPDLAKQLGGLKKAELAAEAEARLSGSRWLPAMLRPQPVTAPALDDIEDEGEDCAEALDEAA